MFKKIALSIVVVCICTCLTSLIAQEEQRPGGPPPGRPGRGPSENAALSAFDKGPLPNSDKERKILGVIDELDKARTPRMMNVSREDGRMLRLLAESTSAKNVVEIGTSNGYSGLWFSIALAHTGGKLTTIEIDSQRASLARQNFKKAGVDNIVTLIEGDAHNELSKVKGPVDVLFLDADKDGYIDYLNKLLPLVKRGGLIIAHNISGRQADPKFVEAINSNPDLESILLQREEAGISVTLKKLSSSQKVETQVKVFHEPDVIFVPTPQDVVDKMLELAEVKKTDLVYDLGCGDGRIVVTAAKKYGTKAFGFDVDPNRIEESLENVKKNNVEDLVTIVQEDIFTLDLSKPDVITLYLLPSLNVKLIPQLEKCKPGTRIVSHDFDMAGVIPEKQLSIASQEDGSLHEVYLWIAPIKKEK
jgi:predicted O-methyltransferase YrrM